MGAEGSYLKYEKNMMPLIYYFAYEKYKKKEGTLPLDVFLQPGTYIVGLSLPLVQHISPGNHWTRD